jgi:oxygen-independent coproporphyrinogen-3 oxidase
VDLADDLEITVELNPGDVDEGRATRWLELGISRASVGVQSFDDEELRFLGRRHDGSRAREVLKGLRAAGFRSIGIDLIWGLPKQTKQQALFSLDQALALAPEHLSCYELTIEEGTPLHRDVLRGREKRLCEDDVVDLAHAVWGRLSEAGYDHYEVSNFAKTREHRSRHNMKYWRHVPYLGLGPSAHSFDGGHGRWANVASVGAYCEAVGEGRRPTVFEEELTEDQLRCERVAMGMRTSEGVEAGLVDESEVISLEEEGLLRMEGGRVRPTERGMLVADALALALTRDGKANKDFSKGR